MYQMMGINDHAPFIPQANMKIFKECSKKDNYRTFHRNYFQNQKKLSHAVKYSAALVNSLRI